MLSGRGDDAELYSARERPAVYGGLSEYARRLFGNHHEVWVMLWPTFLVQSFNTAGGRIESIIDAMLDCLPEKFQCSNAMASV